MSPTHIFSSEIFNKPKKVLHYLLLVFSTDVCAIIINKITRNVLQKKNKLCQFVPQRLSDFQPPYRVVYLKALLFNMICSLWLDCQKITTLVSVVTRLSHKWHDGKNELEMELAKNPSSMHLIISAAIQLEPSILLCNGKIDICLFLIFIKMHCIEAPCIQT